METIFLESWLHDIIKERSKVAPEYGLSGKEAPAAVTRADVKNFQLFKLRNILTYTSERSVFYKELFTENGIKPESIKSLADLDQIPFTDPSDLAANPYRFVCVSLGDVARVTTFTTSGTTGPQKRVFCTTGDMERMIDFMAVGMRTIATSKDVVQIMLPFGSENNQGDLLAKGIEKIGAFPVRAVTTLSADEQVNLIKQHKSTVLVATPARIYRITQEMQGKHDLTKMRVKTLLLTSGYLSEPMKARLKSVWNCDVHSHYGMTEMGLAVAIECHAHSGYHLNEADLLLETVDPQTGKITEGEGELVFTTLSREGTPLIRYRTHDISRLITTPCPCGATTLLKFAKITKRIEAIVKIEGGDEIYPSLFDELLYQIPEAVDYQVTLSRADSKDNLAFVIECPRPGSEIEQKLKRLLSGFPLIRGNISAGRMSEPKVELVALGELKRGGRAKKMIVDNRK